MNLEDQLIRDEGFVGHAYTDSLGYLTIGIGRLIDRRKGGGISHDEALYLLRNDIAVVESQLTRKWPWVAKMNAARRGALINMAFQLGVNGLAGFKNTLSLLRMGQYQAAAQEALNSAWAGQTPARAKRVAEQIRTGEWV